MDFAAFSACQKKVLFGQPAFLSFVFQYFALVYFVVIHWLLWLISFVVLVLDLWLLLLSVVFVLVVVVVVVALLLLLLLLLLCCCCLVVIDSGYCVCSCCCVVVVVAVVVVVDVVVYDLLLMCFLVVAYLLSLFLSCWCCCLFVLYLCFCACCCWLLLIVDCCCSTTSCCCCCGRSSAFVVVLWVMFLLVSLSLTWATPPNKKKKHCPAISEVLPLFSPKTPFFRHPYFCYPFCFSSLFWCVVLLLLLVLFLLIIWLLLVTRAPCCCASLSASSDYSFLLLIFSFFFIFLFFWLHSSCSGSSCVYSYYSAVSSSSSSSSSSSFFFFFLVFLFFFWFSDSCFSWVTSLFFLFSCFFFPLCFLCILCFSYPPRFPAFLGVVGLYPKRWSLFWTPCFPAFFGVLGRYDGVWSLFWNNKEGNLVPPCRSLSSSLLLAGAKNTRNIVVSGDNSGSKVKRENGDVAFWAKKGKNTTKIGVKKRALFTPRVSLFFRAFLAQKSEVQKMQKGKKIADVGNRNATFLLFGNRARSTKNAIPGALTQKTLKMKIRGFSSLGGFQHPKRQNGEFCKKGDLVPAQKKPPAGRTL